MGKKKSGPATVPAFEFAATPTSLDEALKVIETMRSAVEAGIEKMDTLAVEIGTKNARIEELEGEVSGLEDENDQLEKQINELEDAVSLDGEAIEELACIEQKMKRGRPGAEVRGDLDRLLQKIDCGGAHRMHAVPVML